ncbi:MULTISPECIES: response regulator [unclassified Chamaesiphon]|uniref:response regulator n=1 Tax=unclassified Chamaesiphon TaxID=2620921 RepID=UPI00286B72DB|nr:response regulator [Chamaesiphon sp. OTE_8_metabat_110]
MLKNSRLNILLVEDDEVDVMTVQRAFKQSKITNPLYIAGNGSEALAMLRGKTGEPALIPSDRRLVLLDLNMPAMNGLDFLRQLRSDAEIGRIPVIIITTSDEKKYLTDAYELNVSGYLKKPSTYDKFVELIVVLNDYWTACEMN